MDAAGKAMRGKARLRAEKWERRVDRNPQAATRGFWVKTDALGMVL